MTKTEQAVIRAAMRESRNDLRREWGYRINLSDKRIARLATFYNPAKAARLRACVAHAKSLKGRK